MKTNRNFQIAPIIAVAVTSGIGFAVAFKVAPNIAWGRLFIDLGVVLSIVFLGLASRRKPSHDVIQVENALRELSNGHYDTRLQSNSNSECADLICAFNELAIFLSDKSMVSDEQKLSEKIPSLAWKTPASSANGHSHHPELGPVKTLGLMRETLSQYSSSTLAAKADRDVGPVAKISELHELPSLQNTSLSTNGAVEVASDNKPSIIIEDLYSEYARARKENNLSEVTFDVFKTTIEETRKVLLTQHECKAVKFDIVSEKGEVALRPRLVR